MPSSMSDRVSPRPEIDAVRDWEPDIARAAAHWARRSRRSSPDDLAQEARVALMGVHRNTGCIPQRLGRVVLRNAILSVVRSDVRAPQIVNQHANAQADYRAAPEPTPDQCAGLADLCGRVRDWLRLQPEKFQRLYHGLFVEGRSQADMAAILSITEARVSQLLGELIRRGEAGLHGLVAA